MSSTPDAAHLPGDGTGNAAGDVPGNAAGDLPGNPAGPGASPAPATDVVVDPAPGPGAHGAPVVTPARRRRLLRLIAVLAVLVLAADQASKAWALSALTEGERTDVVGDLLGLTLLFNPGAALSIATGMTWVLTLVAVVVVVVTVRASRRIGSATWAVALGLLLGGAVGNLVDRFLREPGPARGHVVDFIAYGNLFVGNVADIAIVGAAGLIVLLALRGIGLDGSREHHVPQHRADPRHPMRDAEHGVPNRYEGSGG